jgi:hypothetical protein
MSVRPTLLQDINRTTAQQHQANVGIGTYNRFSALSGAGPQRGHVLSVGKRQLENQGEPDGHAQKAPKLDSNLVFDQLKEQDTILAEVETTIAEIEKSNVETPDLSLNMIIRVLKLLGKSQKNLTSAVTDNCELATTAATAINTGTKQVGQKKNSVAPGPPPPSEEELKVKKVKAALREAEKKTVLFNLNLGKNPAMNISVMLRKSLMIF